MNQKYTKEQISQCRTAYNHKAPVAKLVEKYKVPQGTIYAWLKREQQKKQTRRRFVTLKEYRILENRLYRYCKHFRKIIIEFAPNIAKCFFPLSIEAIK